MHLTGQLVPVGAFLNEEGKKKHKEEDIFLLLDIRREKIHK